MLALEVKSHRAMEFNSGARHGMHHFKTNFIRLTFAAFLLSSVIIAVADEPPRMAQIKAAAEAGNPTAQDQLGQAYRSQYDSKNSEVWFRKAASQDVAHAQWALGNTLMGRATTAYGKPDVMANTADEAIQWFLKAASQGYKRAQVDLGRQYEQGRFIKQDYVEAYKWYALAADPENLFDPLSLEGKWARDAVILKMSQSQIAEARARVTAFTPHHATKDELPEPAWVKQIQLKGVSGSSSRRLALINGKTFEAGDKSSIKVSGKAVKVHCVEVKESSAVISIEGINGTRELRISK